MADVRTIPSRTAKAGRKRSELGFTLIEILIALVVTGILLAGIYRIFGSQEQSHLVVDEMAEVNQNLRVAMHLITRDLRMAGFHLEGGVTTSGIGNLNAVHVVDGGGTNPDYVELIYALSDIQGVLKESMAAPDATIKVANALEFIEALPDGKGLDDADAPIIVTNGASTSLFRLTGIIDGDLSEGDTLKHEAGVYVPDLNDSSGHQSPNPFPTYAPTSRVYQTVFRRYCIDPNHEGKPVLRRDDDFNPADATCTGQVIADNIENLQIDPATDNSRIFTVTLTARTNRPLMGVGGDRRRRKTISQRVRVRNIMTP